MFPPSDTAGTVTSGTAVTTLGDTRGEVCLTPHGWTGTGLVCHWVMADCADGCRCNAGISQCANRSCTCTTLPNPW